MLESLDQKSGILGIKHPVANASVQRCDAFQRTLRLYRLDRGGASRKTRRYLREQVLTRRREFDATLVSLNNHSPSSFSKALDWRHTAAFVFNSSAACLKLPLPSRRLEGGKGCQGWEPMGFSSGGCLPLSDRNAMVRSLTIAMGRHEISSSRTILPFLHLHCHLLIFCRARDKASVPSNRWSGGDVDFTKSTITSAAFSGLPGWLRSTAPSAAIVLPTVSA